MRLLPLLLPCCLATASQAECWEDAARTYGLDPLELGAIACVESSMNANAVSPAGARGVMQVMPSHAVRVGLHPDRLFDPCINIYMGAYVLADLKARYGDTWVAVGAYNASCTVLKGTACRQARADYAWAVYRARLRLERTGKCS